MGNLLSKIANLLHCRCYNEKVTKFGEIHYYQLRTRTSERIDHSWKWEKTQAQENSCLKFYSWLLIGTWHDYPKCQMVLKRIYILIKGFASQMGIRIIQIYCFTDSKWYCHLNCRESRKRNIDPNGKLIMLHLLKSIWWESRNAKSNI